MCLAPEKLIVDQNQGCDNGNQEPPTNFDEPPSFDEAIAFAGEVEMVELTNTPPNSIISVEAGSIIPLERLSNDHVDRYLQVVLQFAQYHKIPFVAALAIIDLREMLKQMSEREESWIPTV